MGVRSLATILLLSLLYQGGIASRAEAQDSDLLYVPGEILVQWSSEDDRIPLTRVAGYELVRQRALGDGLWLYQLSERSKEATLAVLASLEGLRQVIHAEPNFIRHTFAVPNDPHYSHQWNLTAINMPKAWDRTKGSAGVVVAVVDTGILPGHPDLAGRLLPGYDFISTPASAGDGNGWDSNPKDMGTDAYSSSAHHGTHVAGVLAANSHNSVGMAGVDWRAKILPVRALGVKEGNGTDADVIVAIRWAAGLSVPGVPKNPNPAKVLNMSFGATTAGSSLTNAVQAALGRGVIVVAAVGNNNRDGGAVYPAAISGVITVGAVQRDLKRAPYSNFGKVVDIMAPGGNLKQTLPPQLKCQGKPCKAGILGPLFDSKAKTFTYRFYEGTSQAAPMVSGVISLMVSLRGNLTAADARAFLRQTANPVSKCTKGCGAGLVNADAVLAQVAKGGGGKMTNPGGNQGNGSGATPGGSTGGSVSSQGVGGCAVGSPADQTWPVMALLLFALLTRRIRKS